MAQNIQWYPGHMHKAMREIKAVAERVDVYIELLDARIPYSSENPSLKVLRGNKPSLKLLNKSDLADTKQTAVWLEYFSRQARTQAIAINAKTESIRQQIVNACEKLYGDSGGHHLPMTVLIHGIPNVGKSTLINRISERSIAKTGNEAAVTRMLQQIRIGTELMLIDTPGVLWPNIVNHHSGYRLAITGAIRQTAVSFADIALYAAGQMLVLYPKRLQARYKLSVLPEASEALIEAIGAKRGCLMKGGRVDFTRAATIFIDELRSGVLGPVTLETPDMQLTEEKEVAEIVAAREEKKRKRKAEWRKQHGKS